MPKVAGRAFIVSTGRLRAPPPMVAARRPRPSQVRATRSICSSSDKELMRDVSSSTTGSSPWSSSTAASLSSEGFDPKSGSVTSSLASNSRALMMMKQTFSGEIVSVAASWPAGISVLLDLACMWITGICGVVVE